MRTRTQLILLGILLLLAFGLGTCARTTPAVSQTPLPALGSGQTEATVRLMAYLAAVNPFSGLLCLCPGALLLTLGGLAAWGWKRRRALTP